MLSWNNRAHGPSRYPFQVIRKRFAFDVFEKPKAVIGGAGEQGPQGRLDTRHHNAIAGFAAPARCFPKRSHKGLAETAVRLEPAVKGRVIQTSPLAYPHKCPGHPVASAPGGKTHPVVLLEPAPRA